MSRLKGDSGGEGTMRRNAPVLALLVGLIVAFGGLVTMLTWFSMYRVPSMGMSPTFVDGDRIFVSSRGSEFYRGDVVVFHGRAWDTGADAPFVMRVVGVGGDTAACCDEQGRLLVNGLAVEEPYLAAPDPDRPPIEFSAEVPADSVFVLGDNRANSRDSRLELDRPNRGAIPVSDLFGVVIGVSGSGAFAGPTPAFVDAGLSGGPRGTVTDSIPLFVLLGGVTLSAIGLVWIVIARIRAIRRRRSEAVHERA